MQVFFHHFSNDSGRGDQRFSEAAQYRADLVQRLGDSDVGFKGATDVVNP
jgi:hypothetical protein